MQDQLAIRSGTRSRTIGIERCSIVFWTLWQCQIVLILQADCSKPLVQRPRRISRPFQFWPGARLDCLCRGVRNGAVSLSDEAEAVSINTEVPLQWMSDKQACMLSFFRSAASEDPEDRRDVFVFYFNVHCRPVISVHPARPSISRSDLKFHAILLY